jgi:TRAP-type C4-dicarboxylate transport system permease small subunit
MLKTAYSYVCKAEAAVAATFLILMVALIFLGGVARMMSMPLVWTTDFATCFFAWACFLCADIAWRNNGLMSIRLLADRLPERLQGLLECINYLIVIAFMFYLIGAGLWLSYVSRARSFQGIQEISYSWITMSLPVGGMLLLVTTLIKLRREIMGQRMSATPPDYVSGGA